MSLRGDCRKPGSAPPSCLPLLRWRAYYFYGCVWQLEQASGDLVVVCSGIYVFEWAGQTGMRRCCWRKAGKEPSTGLLLLLLLLKNSDRKTENRPLSTAGTPGKQKIRVLALWLWICRVQRFAWGPGLSGHSFLHEKTSSAVGSGWQQSRVYQLSL